MLKLVSDNPSPTPWPFGDLLMSAGESRRRAQEFRELRYGAVPWPPARGAEPPRALVERGLEK